MRRSVRLAAVAATIVIGLLLIAGLVAIVSYSDIVERSYQTKEEASEDGAFERGWLPDYIPQSATRISVRRNRDVCVTEGSFDFARSDFVAFSDAIRSADSGKVWGGIGAPKGWKEDLIEAGYKAYKVSRKDGSALFFVHPEQGHCVFATAARVPREGE